MKYLITFIGLFFSIQLAFSQHGVKKFEKIQHYLDKATQEGLIGVSVYIKHPSWGSWTGVSGWADKNKQEKLTPDHLMFVASVGKTYAATATMLLAEEGKLSLDDLIANYLPDSIISCFEYGEKITIRHLLSMTSGIFNYERIPALFNGYLEGNIQLDTLSHEKVVCNYLSKEKALFPPGQSYHYSSSNYLLLGLILDQILQKDHAIYYQERLFPKSQLKTTFYRNAQPLSQKISAAYTDLDKNGEVDDWTKEQQETTEWFTCDDGIVTTAAEAGKFMEALLTGKVVNPASLEAMQQWVMPKKEDYGLGLMHDKSFPYGHAIGHSGSAIGAAAEVYYFPKQKITVAICSNTGKRMSHPKYAKAYYKLIKRIALKLFL